MVENEEEYGQNSMYKFFGMVHASLNIYLLSFAA